MGSSHFHDIMTDKKFPNVGTQETDCPMTPPAEVQGSNPLASVELELGGTPIPGRPELESPKPWTPELASQKTEQRRLGMSSPDPSPIRSRIPSTVMPSPVTAWAASGEPSPEAELGSATSTNPEMGWTESRQRPSFPRMDSSEAESAALPRRRPLPLSIQQQTGSLDSDSGWSRAGMPPVSVFRRTDSSSSGPWAHAPGRISVHGKLGSDALGTSWDTKMGMGMAGPSGAYYGASRAQATPSPLLPSTGHEEARSAMSSPEIGSDLSGLISPELSHRRFEDSRESSVDVPRSAR